MKAAQINEYGHADVIEVSDIAKPTLGEGQVLVEVHAASINPFDTIVREGHVAQMIKSLPVTLGGDIAGVVTEVGSGVTEFAVGDKVYGQANAVAGNSGAFAEFAATAASQVGNMPANLSFVEAGAIPLTGESALQVITGHMKLAPGQKILIHGGAGGIGTVAIQIAKHLGAYVATTATGEGIQYVTDLGADEVIDYASQKFEDSVHDYDAVFDTVGGDTYVRSFGVL
jgi:NADPH:quinone reductase-like Zn-dependent oxidoreductase